MHDFFTQTHFFSIKEIDLKGAKYISLKDVLKQAGVTKGDNLLSINLNSIRKRLLAHPWIEDVQVSRNIPDGLQIQLTEYQPEAIAKVENELYLMNDKGILFKAATESDPKNLPLITGLKYTDIPILHLRASSQFETARKVLLMGRETSSLIPQNKIRKIIVDSDLGITLEAFEPSVLIRIGHKHYPEKYNNLKRVLKSLKNQNEQIQASFIDLSDLEQIVVTPVNLESPHQG